MVTDRDRNRKGILISDCRVTSLEINLTDWPDAHYEPGLSIVLVRFRLAPRDYGLTAERLAFISHHALGRRFQRGLGQSDADVIGDLAPLVIGHDRLMTCQPFICRTKSGVWAGDPTALEGRRDQVLAVRTFM